MKAKANTDGNVVASGGPSVTMSGGESRSRRPKYKEYKRVRDARNFAQKLGVRQVEYGDNLVIANVANYALLRAYERHISMPARLIVKNFRSEDNEDPNEYAYYLPGAGNAPGEIYINSRRKVWLNIQEAMREGQSRNVFSTDDPCHIVLHELGELAMHQSVGGERFYPFGEKYLKAEREFQQMDPVWIRRIVSDRAAANHAEFVAEVFTALILGREQLRHVDEVMEAFERFGGVQMIEWTR